MKKDCCNCVYWNPAEEECKINDLVEFDIDKFFEICPISNGAFRAMNSEE